MVGVPFCLSSHEKYARTKKLGKSRDRDFVG
jgi:AhpD family alkylhydroperoxidase